jgi:hypothetical protein
VGQLQLAFQEFQLEGEKIGDLLNWVGVRERDREGRDYDAHRIAKGVPTTQGIFFELADHVMFSAPVSFFFNN